MVLLLASSGSSTYWSPWAGRLRGAKVLMRDDQALRNARRLGTKGPIALRPGGATIQRPGTHRNRRTDMKAPTQPHLTQGDAVVRLVHRAPVTVFLDTPLRVCARVMEEESIGAVLVVSGHETVGMLSERAIVAAVANGAGVDFHRARDYMTADVDTMPETATIGEAMAEMLRN